MEKRLVKIEKDIEEASGFENYKKIGELIQINLSKIKKGMKQVTLEDIYVAPPQEISITLGPALTPVENAEAYFKKHRKGREGLELLKRRLEISQQEREQMALMLADLETDFESSFKRYENDLLPLMPKENGKTELATRLPYRIFNLLSGLTIYVGRDGSDNDRTTFEFARPYELWFHAQQCPGSHVIIKFPNKSFIPSKSEIQETAAITAFFSKARKDSLVPVIYTERKYVRKPRKAKPGLVTVEREKSIMVTPRKPD